MRTTILPSGFVRTTNRSRPAVVGSWLDSMPDLTYRAKLAAGRLAICCARDESDLLIPRSLRRIGPVAFVRPANSLPVYWLP